MFAALIFVISVAMMAQFAIFFWRSSMLATAAEPISEALTVAQSSFGAVGTLTGFDTVAAMSQICPAIGVTTLKLWPTRAYYQGLRLFSLACSAILPLENSWARQEMAFCTRYLAVSIDRRLISNQAYLAAMRSC